MAETKRKRGRPATIDSDAAMQAVVELFRDKGFAAVSLDDLSETTGLSRPSLYRAFGNKMNMYLGAMDMFGAQVAETAVPVLRQDGPLAKALTDFYEAMLDIYYRDTEIAPGCLVFGTAPSSADIDEVKARLQFGTDSVDALMRARISQAAPGAPANQIETCTQIASNTLIAFSARAKAGAEREALSAMGASAAKAISTLLDGA